MPMNPSSYHPDAFPANFTWGVSTAAFQIEGGASADGKGPSTWDTFCQEPGRIQNDATGKVACDHYHRYQEDIDIIQNLGVGAYRFSLSWSRMFPEGRGAPNQAGFDFYDRLIDGLLAKGITPWVTLFHWDTPDALQKTFGGWASREIADCFADYATAVGKHFGDRVKNFFTTNEFNNITDRGYYLGQFAPGLNCDIATRNQTRHNALLAHGKGVQALRATVPDARIGLAEDPVSCVPIMDTPEHVEAARKAYRLVNARFLTAVLEGGYPEEYLEDEGANAPEIREGDFDIISSPIDLLGINAYTPTHIRAADNERGFEQLPKPAAYPRMDIDWLYLEPDILYWGCRFLKELWNVPELYVSENGCPCADSLNAQGEVLDTDRIMYLRHHLRSATRAISEGYPLKGYFQWSLMDNFEWANGYNARFGLYYVNYETLERIEKLSAKYYRQVIQANRVL